MPGAPRPGRSGVQGGRAQVSDAQHRAAPWRAESSSVTKANRRHHLRDPNLKSWSAHMIGGRKMQLLGYIEVVDETAAIERAVVLFAIDDERRKRLAVNLRR
jgi:hypothetical protein